MTAPQALPRFRGKRFAFTILDDTDVATVDNVRPVYRLLEELGMRVTKTVWPLSCPDGSPDFGESQTLEDPDYHDFVLDLHARGFEIASHGATMESSDRGRTLEAFEFHRQTFGHYPKVHANHALNRENIYWGSSRIASPILKALYRKALGDDADRFVGHLEESRYWWGDFCQEHVCYVRNLTFNTLNVARINPSMPYHDPERPLVNWWFSAADAEDCHSFNRLLNEASQRRLETEGGVSIVATHLGKGFVKRGRVHPTTERLLRHLASRDGWFVPVGELLDELRARRSGAALPQREWRHMQWRWAIDLIRRRLRRS